ncbi:MAG: GNAT family N-acetyltransferase [Oscillospiraceae bacterium]
MSAYPISGEKLESLQILFKDWNETLIYSCLQGYMGTAWADSTNNPKSAQIVVADFCFFAGEPDEILVKNKPKEHNSDFVIMVPQDEQWAKMIEKIYGENAHRVTRYAIKKEPDIFDVKKLKAIVNSLNSEYEIRLIDKEIFAAARKNSWSADLCSQFGSFEEYAQKGVGVAVLYKGELVSGASSYTVYGGGIEIEIDTREDYRRKGLAIACGAQLIIECISRNIYPSWDAQNKASVALALKLGYHFDKEYIAYEVSGYGRE